MLHFIVAPYHLGNRNVGVGSGPLRVLETAIGQHIGTSTYEVQAGGEGHWTEVNRRLAEGVREARGRGEFPLVLAGNCNSCLGTLSAIRDLDPGIVWFDAHGDF